MGQAGEGGGEEGRAGEVQGEGVLGEGGGEEGQAGEVQGEGVLAANECNKRPCREPQCLKREGVRW